MIKIYGIPNCNSVKKAFDFFKLHEIEFEFHDYKKLGISEKKINKWLEKFDFWVVVNKKGSTYKTLNDEEKLALENKKIDLLLLKNSLLKRPIIEKNEKAICVGFDENEYLKIFKK